MIRVLDEHVIRRIAAGEVVDRPASVVKELVENALDAGARQVSVHLDAGGRDRIRVEDDGSGMSRDDAKLCTERHATSKIRSDDDLFGVTTLGFRGEALPSIASVSRFTLTTRRPEDDLGTRIRIDGTSIVIDDVGCPPGTVVEAKDLFHAVPARRKFLRAEATEVAHAVEAVLRQAAIRPEVAFSVDHDGRRVVDLPRVSDLRLRAVGILGADARDLIPVNHERLGVRVRGLAGPPSRHRAEATGAQYLYVNGRFVRDPLVRRAVTEAYRDLLPRGRHPVLLLEIDVPAAQVDVNVHPAKTEVRFSEPAAILQVVQEAVARTVAPPPKTAVDAQPLFDAGASRRVAAFDAPAAPPRRAESPPRPMLSAHPDDDPRFTSSPPPLPVVEPPPPLPIVAEPDPVRTPTRLGPLGEFVLARDGDTLWIIDPVRWWRRRWAREVADDPLVLGPSRRLDPPEVVPVGPSLAARLDAVAAELGRLGVRWSMLGARQLAFLGVPSSVARAAIPDLVDAWSALAPEAPASAWTLALVDVAEPDRGLPQGLAADDLDAAVAWAIAADDVARYFAGKA